MTLVFAARLSQRIRRLSRAASTALTPEGRIEPHIPGHAGDATSWARWRAATTRCSAGCKEYTNYLQTLGTKLSHELRTPLTIVSSSLDNLASEETLPPPSQSYLERARSGANRMHAILTAMTEATRVEQSIEHTERVRFDLRELVRNMGQAYRADVRRAPRRDAGARRAVPGRRLARPDRAAARQAHGQRERTSRRRAARSRSRSTRDPRSCR